MRTGTPKHPGVNISAQARAAGILPKTLYSRLYRGISLEVALTMKKNSRIPAAPASTAAQLDMFESPPRTERLDPPTTEELNRNLASRRERSFDSNFITGLTAGIFAGVAVSCIAYALFF